MTLKRRFDRIDAKMRFLDAKMRFLQWELWVLLALSFVALGAVFFGGNR
jgi:hypothetical protein